VLTPPYRFTIVEDGVYRGGHPSLKNFRFLRRFVVLYALILTFFRLRLKSIVSLLSEEPSIDLLEFCTQEGIKNFHFEVNTDKEKMPLRTQVVVQVLEVSITEAQYCSL